VDRAGASVDPVSGIGVVRFVVPDLASAARREMPAGLTGEARVAVGTHSDAIAVSESALRERDGDEAEVLVCDGAHARTRSVRLGAAARAGDGGATFVIVREGLAAGDRIVVDDTAGIEDGAAIDVRAP
jgi:multidrug efflux pump subunit AcrA (membrane-fusion protein)